MNPSVFEYYKKDHFNDVIIVDKNSSYSFDQLQELVSDFPKAWYELSNLSIENRIEFSRDFCLTTLPFKPHVYQFIYDFFQKLDDIYVIMSKRTKDDPYIVELVYSLEVEDTFFRGKTPLSDEKIRLVNSTFNDILPQDFMVFLKIHDGFAKGADTGIFESEKIFEITKEMHSLIESEKKEIKCKFNEIDPKNLIFFYQCYQKMDFQCFYIPWHPLDEIGNVYFSFVEASISEYHNTQQLAENLAFPTFLDWLIFYLEEIEI